MGEIVCVLLGDLDWKTSLAHLFGFSYTGQSICDRGRLTLGLRQTCAPTPSGLSSCHNLATNPGRINGTLDTYYHVDDGNKLAICRMNFKEELP